MKAINKIFLIVTLGVMISSCKKEEVEVVSLSKAGKEFYFGEKVLVYAPTVGDKADISYEWKASEGYFIGDRTQNLFENLWVAPAKVGTYQVSVTAKNGKNTSTKTTDMNVTRYFFDNFQSTYAFRGNGWIQSNLQGDSNPVLVNTEDDENSAIVLQSKNTSEPYIRRNLDLAELKAPFSIRTRLSWEDYFRPDQNFTIQLTFQQPLKNLNYPFIRQIRFEVWPVPQTSTGKGTRQNNNDTYRLRYETYVPLSNKANFNPGTPTTANPAPIALVAPFSGNDPKFLMPEGVKKSITFSVDANYVFTVSIDGQPWLTSNGMKDWIEWAKANYPGFEDPIAKEFRFVWPRKASGSAPGTKILLNSVYINNDGTKLD